MSFLNWVFNLYIKQAQCRDLWERKPVFWNNSLQQKRYNFFRQVFFLWPGSMIFDLQSLTGESEDYDWEYEEYDIQVISIKLTTSS